MRRVLGNLVRDRRKNIWSNVEHVCGELKKKKVFYVKKKIPFWSLMLLE